MNQLKLREMHANSLRNGIDFSSFLVTKLTEILDFPYAHKLLDTIPNPTVFHYNKLIQAYSSSHAPSSRQCFSVYLTMLLRGFLPNAHSFNFLFSACTNLSDPFLPQAIHAHFLKWGFESDIYASTALVDTYAKLGLLNLARRQFDGMPTKDVPTWNTLIAGYAKHGDMREASRLFSTMPLRNVISWTAMISGYSQNGEYADALALYLEMEKHSGVRPNQVTVASVLPACANLGALEVGQRIEAYAKSNGYLSNLFVCNAILEMYARCGRIDSAMRLFHDIGRRRRNLCSWNTMIMGLAIHGKSNEALELFHQMLVEGISPDDVTFVGAILACTHGGMVAKGQQLFYSMKEKFSITPRLEHYGCMIDLLGRAGQLQEAYHLIRSMPMRPDSVIWGTMLGACSFYGNVELAEKAAESLFELEPCNPGNYVILSNIYATSGRWDGVAKMRRLMKGSQITKAAGYSFMEEGGQLHKFIVEDRFHPRCNEIYALLYDVHEKIKLLGHTTDIDSITEETWIADGP